MVYLILPTAHRLSVTAPVRAASSATLRAALAACPALLLAACGSMPVTVLSTDLPPTFAAAPVTAIDAATPDLLGWWQALGDPRLDALVDQALAQNLTLAQAHSRWRAVRRLATADGSRFLPTLDAGVHTVQDAAAIDNYLHAGIDASWEIGLFGRQPAVELGSQARIAEAVAAEQAARVSVVAEVVHQYVLLRTARHADVLMQRMIRVDDRLLALHAVRDHTRLGSADQRRDVLLRRSRTEAAQAAPRQAAAAAVEAMAVLLAQTRIDLPAIDAAGESGPPAAPVGLRLQQVPADLLRFRPDVRLAEADVGRATSELGLARAELYPRLTLGLSYIYSYNLTQNRRNLNADLPAFGLGLDIPIFDWGRRRAVADAREEALDAALLGYRQALLEAYGETEGALAAFTAAGARVERLAEAERLVVDRLAQQATRERLGLGNQVERLELERAALQSQADQSEASSARTEAFVRVYKALGGAPLGQVAAAQPMALGAASPAAGAR